MPDTDEIPAELVYQQQEGTNGYDCWRITVNDVFIGYVYISTRARLIPTKLEFEPELVVHTVY